MTDRYAVVGNPVAHSKSPLIHAEFARQTGQDIEYGRLLAPLDGFRATVEEFRGAGGSGLNVTVPFKLEAFELAQQRSARALDAAAVNTLKFESDGIFGDNTDGVGLVRDLEGNLGFAIAGKRVLLMGAGGAAQGVMGPLLAARSGRWCWSAIAPWTRRAGWWSVSARAAAGRRAARKQLRRARRQAVRSGHQRDLGEPERHRSRVARRSLRAGCTAYDMMYGKGLTPFLRAGAAGGRVPAGRRPRHAGGASRRILLRVARRAAADCSGHREAQVAVKVAALALARRAGASSAWSLLYFAWIFSHVLWWNFFNPSSSAFMQDRLETLQEKNPKAKLRHQWVPYDKISLNLKRALVAAEDANFMEHAGFDWDAIQRAYEKNLKKRQGGRGRLHHQPAAGQEPVPLAQAQRRAQARGGAHHAHHRDRDEQGAHLRDLPQHHRVGQRRVRLRGGAPSTTSRPAPPRLDAWEAAKLAAMVPNPRYYDRNRNTAYLNRKTNLILGRMPSAAVP